MNSDDMIYRAYLASYAGLIGFNPMGYNEDSEDSLYAMALGAHHRNGKTPRQPSNKKTVLFIVKNRAEL